MIKFLILGTPRTGSSAIAQLINLNHRLLCGFEWTYNVPRQKKITIADELLRGDSEILQDYLNEDKIIMPESTIFALGFKILFRSSNKYFMHPKNSVALWFDNLSGHLKWLKINPNIHIIHTIRENNLDWLISYFLSKKTKLYSGTRYPDDIKININTRNAVRRVKSKLWIDSQIRMLRFSNPYLKIVYEDFKHDYRKIAYEITNFLGFNDKLNFDLFRSIKQSKNNAHEYLRNYSKIHQILEEQNLLQTF